MRTRIRILLFSLAVLMGLCGSQAWAQTIQGTNPNTCTAGQSISMVITGSNTTFTAVTSFRLMSSNGQVVNPTSYTINSNTSATANFSISPNAPLGAYRLQSFQYPDYFNALNVGVGQGSNYGWVSGRVVHDQDNNCVYTNGLDNPVNAAVVILNPGGHLLTTDADGTYGGWIPLGTYTASYQPGGCTSWICPISGTHPVSILTSLSTDVGNDFHFGDTPNCADLQSSIATSILRPGFTVPTWVSFSNNGPNDYSNAVGTFTLPSVLSIQSISPAPASVSGNTVTWNIANLPANSYISCGVVVTVPPNIGLNTTLMFTSSLPSSGIDYNPNNNNSVHYGTTQGSFDPNDKQVWDEQGFPADGPVDPNVGKLKYLIRFQNTGTDTAFNIFVRDTLDALLDPGSINILGSSHPYQFSMNGTGNAQFTFPNILLVDSFHNEPLSHGWIQYEIDVDPGLPIGTVIPNNADIYFDYNAPVATNTTHTTLCLLVSSSFTASHGPILQWNFTNTSSGGTSYLWDFGDGATSTSANPSHTYFTSGEYEVCLTVSNACRSMTYCDTVDACNTPVPNFTSSVTGLSCNFTNSSTGATGYFWDFGDGSTSTAANPSHTYSTSGHFLVCLTARNACFDIVICDTVDACLTPVSGFTSTASGLSLNFTNNSTNASGYLWDFGDGNTSTSANPTHTYGAVGNYVVCLTASNGCFDNMSCDTVTACVVPTAVFTSSVNGNTATFTDGSHASTTAWAWDFGDGGTSVQQSPTHTYAGPGNYNVCLMTSNGCDVDTICDPLTVLVGITDAQGLQVQVSPNPGRDLFMVEVMTEETGAIELGLFDLAGRQLLSESIPSATGPSRVGLNLNGRSAGMYLLRVRSESGASKVIRLIKE